jgi:hypothetical protein
MGLPTLPAAAPRDRQCGPSGGKWTLRERHDQQRALQPTPSLLTDAEIVRALRRFRYDPEFRGPKRVPIRVLAATVGLSHTRIYWAMRPDLPRRPRKISECTRVRLSWAIAAIAAGRLRFHRLGRRGQHAQKPRVGRLVAIEINREVTALERKSAAGEANPKNS